MESILLIVTLFCITVIFANFFQIKFRKNNLINIKSSQLNERHITLKQTNSIKAKKVINNSEEKDERLVTNAISLIEENFSNPYFNGEQLANKLHTSQRNLQRKFKLVKQSSPSKLIKQHRLAFAVSQLNAGKTIKPVVFDSGFSSQSYFNKCFKAEFGCTPSEYLTEKNGSH